jgi:tetratricopeptide (TPR) repeat protein
MLSQQKESLILWNAYAQMEKSQGKMDEARKVYLTALSMYQTFSESSQQSAPLLYRMFAQLELDQGHPDEALKILVSMSDNKPYGK